jgi:hypothetical protein
MKIHRKELAPGMALLDEAALAQFQKQWATYQKLVDADSLSHREVGDILRKTIDGIELPSFKFLDLACGDAHKMAETLMGTRIQLYRGVDMSQPALDMAAANLSQVPFEVELDHGDFVETIMKDPRPTDITFCSLSIHHLETDEKLKLMTAIRSSTRAFLMIYEPTCTEGETREGYMTRFSQVNQKEWSTLTDEEWQQVEHHTITCDLPETAQTWLELGTQAGFAHSSQVYRNPTDFFRLYRYDC